MRDSSRDREHADNRSGTRCGDTGSSWWRQLGWRLCVCLANFALGHVGAGVAAVIAGLLAFGAGMAWLAMDSRRVRQAERDWFINHPAC